MEHDVSDVTPVDRPPEQSGDSSTQAWSTPGVLNRHLKSMKIEGKILGFPHLKKMGL